MQTINPVTNEEIKTYTDHSMDNINTMVQNSHKAFCEWKKTSFSVRSKLLQSISRQLKDKIDELSDLITLEMGKPIKESKKEIEKCIWVCQFYAENAEGFLKDEVISTDYSKSFVTYRPLGPILGIMPWNYPFWQVFRFVAPTLMAGNCILLKHAENVTGCSLAIENLIAEATPLKNIFQSLLIPSELVASVIENPHIKAVTLTGSTRAGKAVASKAGECLKKTVLELGGSDAYIILEDADLKKAADKCFQSRLLNGGQSCISAKRFIVHKNLKEEFEKLIVDKFKGIKMGDPKNHDTDLGPMARVDLRNHLDQQVRRSIEAGAKLLHGGYVPNHEGSYYCPTVLTNVTKNMPAFDEELFGPVATIIEAASDDQAIQLANASDYGLGSAIFSSNIKQAEKIAAEEIEAGSCFINDFVKSDPRLPFGGIKNSGYGRELSSHGIKEFVYAKTVCIEEEE